MKNGPEVFKGNRRKKGARLVLKHKLYRSDGVIKLKVNSLLTNTHFNKKGVSIVVYWRNDKPVACVYSEETGVMPYLSNMLMAYCLPKHRRNGFSTACINMLTLRGNVYAYETPSYKFWGKQKRKIRIVD
jgi:hypothetical protein